MLLKIKGLGVQPKRSLPLTGEIHLVRLIEIMLQPKLNNIRRILEMTIKEKVIESFSFDEKQARMYKEFARFMKAYEFEKQLYNYVRIKENLKNGRK